MHLEIEHDVVEDLTRKAIDRFIYAPSGHKVSAIKRKSAFVESPWVVEFAPNDLPKVTGDAKD